MTKMTAIVGRTNAEPSGRRYLIQVFQVPKSCQVQHTLIQEPFLTLAVIVDPVHL